MAPMKRNCMTGLAVCGGTMWDHKPATYIRLPYWPSCQGCPQIPIQGCADCWNRARTRGSSFPNLAPFLLSLICLSFPLDIHTFLWYIVHVFTLWHPHAFALTHPESNLLLLTPELFPTTSNSTVASSRCLQVCKKAARTTSLCNWWPGLWQRWEFWCSGDKNYYYYYFTVS